MKYSLITWIKAFLLWLQDNIHAFLSLQWNGIGIEKVIEYIPVESPSICSICRKEMKKTRQDLYWCEKCGFGRFI